MGIGVDVIQGLPGSIDRQQRRGHLGDRGGSETFDIENLLRVHSKSKTKIHIPSAHLLFLNK